MKLFLTIICCLAIPLIAPGADQDHPGKKKKGEAQGQQQQQKPQQQQVRQLKTGRMGKHGGDGAGQMNAGQPDHPRGLKTKHRDQPGGNLAGDQNHLKKGQGKNRPDGQAKLARKEKFQTKHFELKKEHKADIASAKFLNGRRIEGAERWHGQKYVVFQNYHCEWHDHFWWTEHYPRVVLVFGGWYYWNQGYWFPAWGYDPGQSYYAYDGPIYAHQDLSPDQVVANVQSALQEQGYYTGEVDGLLGPLTRAALADYQRDQGLATTAAVDEPTLDSLGLT